MHAVTAEQEIAAIYGDQNLHQVSFIAAVPVYGQCRDGVLATRRILPNAALG